MARYSVSIAINGREVSSANDVADVLETLARQVRERSGGEDDPSPSCLYDSKGKWYAAGSFHPNWK